MPSWPCGKQSSFKAWSKSLEEGLAESLDLTLWSVQRPLEDLEQINEISKPPFGDDWHGCSGGVGRGQRAEGGQETH